MSIVLGIETTTHTQKKTKIPNANINPQPFLQRVHQQSMYKQWGTYALANSFLFIV